MVYHKASYWYFVSYEELSPSYRAFVLVSSDEIPQNIHKATKQSEK